MELKERIVEHALQMFLSAGIKSVRMDDIAADMGVSKRTIYELFDGREDLIFQCMEYHFEREEELVRTLTSKCSNVLEEVWTVVKHGDRFRYYTKSLVENLRKFYPAVYESLLDKHRSRILRVSVDMFRRGIREGFFMPDFNMEYFAEVFTSFLYGVARIESGGGNHPDDNANPAAFIYVMMLFLRGITTEIGRRYMDDNLLDEIKIMGNDKKPDTL